MNRPTDRGCVAWLMTAVLLVTIPAIAHAQETPEKVDPRFAGIAPRINEIISDQEISGAVLLVETKDGVVYLQALGKADIAADRAMRPDTLFMIASMTKPITASAILMLQEAGKLSVDDPVEKYIPELAALKTADGKPGHVTLKQMLTHTSGMSEPSAAEANAAKTLAELMPAIAKKPLQFEPGSKWKYCQSGINALGRVVEVVSGETFPDFLKKRFFEPLGMTNTTFYPTKEQVSHAATSYKRPNGKLEPLPLQDLAGRDPTDHNRYPAANGGLFSTASDYAKFCRMILNNGTVDGRTFLKPEGVKLMTAIQTGNLVTGFTPGNGWGLGWCVVREPQGITAMLSPGTHGHGGARGTQAWIDPVKGAAYILMIQRTDLGNSDGSNIRKTFQELAAKALEQ